MTEDLLATSRNGATTDVVLEVSDLTVGFPSDDGLVQAVTAWAERRRGASGMPTTETVPPG